MRRLLLALLLALVAACSSGGAERASSPASPTTGASRPAPSEPELRAELLAMLERDQSGREGGPDPEGDAARTARLQEVLAEHGWPTYDLVGEDGEDAAWAIAQHADLDPAFQREALEHLRTAVAAGQGSPGNLAYLQDRVDVGAGQPQTYGTQVGCGPDGPQPATPLADEAAAERLRAQAGLQPLADYLAEMEAVCAGG